MGFLSVAEARRDRADRKRRSPTWGSVGTATDPTAFDFPKTFGEAKISGAVLVGAVAITSPGGVTTISAF
jgi:hypothetical protein